MRRRPPDEMAAVPRALVCRPSVRADVEQWIVERRAWARVNGWPLGVIELIREDRRARRWADRMPPTYEPSASQPPRR